MKCSELDQSTSAVGSIQNFNRTLCLANCSDPDQTANHVASNLDQHCLSISQNRDGLTRPIQALFSLDKKILFSYKSI